MEFLELPGGGAAPAPQAPQPEPQPEPPQPEPEPQPEPPQPEPEPQPEPPKPAKPEPPKPAKPEPPKPKKPEPPKPAKPKKPTLEERLRNAQTAKPEKPKAPQKSTKELERQLQERMRRSESNLTRPSVSAPSGGNPNPGLRGAQLNAYQNYLVSCLQPAMQPLWEELGPEALRNAPRPVQVTVTITPEGRLLLGVVSRPSDVDAMNRAAQALLQRMQGMQLPPFSRTGLPTQGSLKFVVNLEYRLQTSR
ncbi:MAG: energy transducer TonB [Oligosphaeraceae bacterium]